MRFIDLDDIKPLIRDLIPALEEAQAIVNQESDPDKRSELIKKYRDRWVALRDILADYSYGKCWYTESCNPGSDDDVDHFRPKGKLADVEGHNGYYWLAFDWTNFRLSCHRANRPRINPETGDTGGKANFFPLVDPETRAYSEADDLAKEEPVLLDPTNVVDVSMVTFDMSGDAVLSPGFKGNSVAERRLAESVRYYHLNWPAFRDNRVVLYNRVERLVDRGSRCAPSGPDRLQVTDAFKETLKDLKKMMNPKEEYSAAIRAYVELFSHEWWIRDILLKAA
jgi:hypothetical protein